jgi:hypothetical protein
MQVEIRVVGLSADASEVLEQIFVHIIREGLRSRDLVVNGSMERQSFVDNFDYLKTKVFFSPARTKAKHVDDVHLP